MIAILYLAAVAAAGSGIQTDCTVKGERVPSFIYTIRDRPDGKRDVDFEPVAGSKVLDGKLVFTATYFTVQPAPPTKDGSPSKERFVTSMGSLDRAGVQFSFLALALINADNKLQPFDLTLHIGPKAIDAMCGHSRAPVDNGSSSQ